MISKEPGLSSQPTVFQPIRGAALAALLLASAMSISAVFPLAVFASDSMGQQEPEAGQQEPGSSSEEDASPVSAPGEPQTSEEAAANQERPDQDVPDLEGSDNEDSDKIVKPSDKPISEMTPEEVRRFRAWRQQQLAERGKANKEDAAPPGSVTFELSFPPGKGGGSASGWAGGIRYQREDLAVLSDGVEILYQEIKISADTVEVDLTEKNVMAFGNVILDQGPRRLAGSTLTFDFESKTGTVTNASAYVDPDFYFSGTEVSKTGENTYSVVDGTFTSCDGDSPPWSFHLGRADIEVDGYARIHHASMRVKKAPVLYLPYMLWPVKADRTSGMLVPNIGYSKRRGAYLGLAYYQVLGQSYDTTFHLDLYSKEFFGLGNEFRYQPTEGTKGLFKGYAIRDPSDGDWRWKIDLLHETTDLPKGMRGVLKIQEFSDFDFFRDFERNIDRNSRRSLESKGFVSGNWGNHSLNILAQRQETFVSDDRSVVLERLPEVEYRLRPTKLGRLPLFLQLESSASFLGVDRSSAQDGTYGRVDLAPQLILPLKVAPWLSASLGGGYRSTWYGESLGTNADGENGFTGDSVTRDFPFASASIVGPSFSRIFDREKGAFSKLKHVIEPRWQYRFFGDIDNRSEIPLFDEIDRLRSSNVGTFSLSNRLLAKPRPKDGEEEGKGGGACEILLWEISRQYSFDQDQPLQRGAFVPALPGSMEDGGDGTVERKAGPISNLIRFSPSERTNLTARVTYNTLFSQLTSTSLSGKLALGRQSVDLSWRTSWNAESGEKRSDQVRLGTDLNLLPERLRLRTDLVFNVEESLLQQQRYLLEYRAQCYGIRLEWRDVIFGDERDQDIRFSLTLKNVGTFLDLTN